MAERADVRSIDAIRGLRPAMATFGEECQAAISSAIGTAQRTLDWIQKDQASHWKRELRVRTDEVSRCKLEFERKKVSASGDPRSAVEERKALDRARKRLETARARDEAIKRWSRALEKEIEIFRGELQPLQSFVSADVPRALHALETMSNLLDEYVAIGTASSEGDAGGGVQGGTRASAGGGSMTRPAAEAELVASLRARVPAEDDRRGASAGRVRGRALAVSLLAENEGLEGIEEDMPGPDETLTVEAGWDGVGRYAMVRLPRCEPSDSGWHVMPASGEMGEVRRVGVGAFLAARPEHRAALSARIGSVVVLREGRVLAVYGPGNELVWSREGGRWV